MNYTARTPGAVGPFQFTVPVGGNRGYYGSQIQEHRVDVPNNWAPKVTDEPVAWRGRRARLKLAAGRRDGETPTADYLEIVSGFLDRSPEKSDTITIHLTIVPDTARLERKVGGDQTNTKLQHGWHFFNFDGDHLFYPPRVRWSEGALWESPITALVPPGTVPVPVGNVERLANNHDFLVGPIDLTYASDVGRAVQVATGVVVGAAAPAGTVTVPAGTPGPARNPEELLRQIAFDTIRPTTPSTYDIIDVTGVGGNTPVAARWPGEAIDRINEVIAPGQLGTAAGRTMDMRLIPGAGEDGARLEARTLTRSHNRPPVLKFITPRFALWYGIDLWDPNTPTENARGRPVDTEPNFDRLGNALYRDEEISELGDDGVASASLAIRGIADAYCRSGDTWLWTEDAPFATPTAADPVRLLITFQDAQNEEHETDLRVVETKLASTEDPVAPGYLHRIHPRDIGRHSSFGDWPGADTAVIRQHVRFVDKPPTTILLELLLSGQGNGVNHPTYDVLPYGANLDQAQVDVTGIENYTVPAVAARQNFRMEETKSIGEVLEPLLRLMGAVLVVRLDIVTGARQLTLVQVGAPTRTDSRHTVADGDWLVSKRPKTTTDTGIINLIIYKLNHDKDGKPQLTVKIADRDSMARYDETAPTEEELIGVRLAGDSPEADRARLLQPALTIFSELAEPRRVLRASIPASDAIDLDPGQVVVVNASDAVGMDGVTGFTSVTGRVIAKKPNWAKNEAELSIRIYATEGVGWAPELEVSALGPGPNEVTVAPGGFVNAFTLADHPITGEPQTDLDYWAIGDVARMVPAGNYGASIAGLVVTATSATTITFGAPPGAAIGDTIRPDDYDAASASHQTYAYLADDAGTLGIGLDPFKVYS